MNKKTKTKQDVDMVMLPLKVLGKDWFQAFF